MIYQHVPLTDIRISIIGLGTVQFGMDYGLTKRISQDEADAVLEASLAEGINLIDTARGYGDSENKIGNFKRRHQDADFLVATKLEVIPKGMEQEPDKLKKWIWKSIEKSMESLDLNCIPILQLHQSIGSLADSDIFWEEIHRAKNMGRIRFFGVSVYEPREVEGIIKNPGKEVDFIQIPYNIFDNSFDLFLPAFRKLNIGVISRSVFLKGMIPAAMDQLPDELGGMLDYKKSLERLALKRGFSISEMALLFAVTCDGIHSTLIGMKSRAEVVDNVNALKRIHEFHPIRKELEDIRIEDSNLTDPRKWTLS
ncbi:MAG: aldo/keto reductase [Candidatus Omnitrophica bacterium]|nr:aldo/keto reductase [Candidatus Omnitrophota bacterium]